MNESGKVAVLNPRAKQVLDLALTLYKANNIDDILTELAAETCRLFGAEAVRLFAYDAVADEIYTRVKLTDTFVELKFPVSETSLAGYTALHRKAICSDDIRDPEQLAAYPRLRYDSRYEDHTDIRVKSIISVPMLENETDLVGLVQLVNLSRPVNDYTADIDFLIHLGKVVATAVFHHDERQHRATKFDFLLEEGAISPEELSRALKIARENADDPLQGDVVSVLMDTFKVPAKAMQASLARYFLTDFLPFDETRIIPPELFKGYNPAYFSKHFVIPIALQDDTLQIVMDNPFNGDLIRELKATYHAERCKLFVGLRKDILKYIEQARGLLEAGNDQYDMAVEDDFQESGDGQEQSDDNILNEDAPLVVQVVNKLILEAHQRGVSDIHIEPGLGAKEAPVRYRKDGVCFQHTHIPASLITAVISRIKVMSGLKLEEHRFPQSGKIRLKYADDVIELRVEVTPTVGRKEDVVMRILAGGTFLSIDDLDLSTENQSALMGMITKPYGILLAVGPTGSGKTTTLHALLHHLNSVEKKIWTVEDPVEITQSGLRQVQVNLNIKPEPFDFAKAMRSFLRADPDIIMVGEMRDKETATIAVEASLTGHLVLSTLHTNSAPETITRLIEMGIDPLNVSDSLLGVLAQRLVRVLCPECKKKYTPDPEELTKLTVACGQAYTDACRLDGEISSLYGPQGCEHCSGTGFRGRMGLHELLPATPDVKQAISTGQPMTAIRDRALVSGMRTLKMDGLRRVVRGQTTLAEVLKVCID